MNWYYVDQGQQAGPVDDAQLEQLRMSGKIQPDTLIWREGMANWAPYSEAKGGTGTGGLRLAGGASASTAPAGAATAVGTSEAVCAECRGVFPVDNMIRYGNVHVCANCKPAFMQKLAEGAQISTGEMRYAGFWLRFGAKFVDGILLRIVATPLGFLIGYSMPSSTPNAEVVAQVLGGGAGFLVAMAYTVWMTGKYGATLGKMACKIHIVTADGGKISYGRAFGRYFAEILSGCPTLFIGYIIAGFDEQKRALHDRICNTRVIFK